MENAYSDTKQMWINPSANIRIYGELAKKIVVFTKGTVSRDGSGFFI